MINEPAKSSSFREPVTLGRTGLRVGRLGIACSYGVPTEAIEAAYHEYGLNYLYWGSVRRDNMRQAIRHLAPTQRERLVIVLQSYDRTGFLLKLMHRHGLRQLRIEYADLLILGWYNRPPAPRVLDAALEMKARGLVRHIAISGHNRVQFPQWAGAENPYDVLMMRYNAAHPGAEQDIFPALPRENRPGLVSYTATSWGTLLNPRWTGSEPPLRASDCYRFALSNPNVNVCLTGPANAGQMREAVEALDAGPLSVEEMARVRRAGAQVKAHEQKHWRRFVAGD